MFLSVEQAIKNATMCKSWLRRTLTRRCPRSRHLDIRKDVHYQATKYQGESCGMDWSDEVVYLRRTQQSMSPSWNHWKTQGPDIENGLRLCPQHQTQTVLQRCSTFQLTDKDGEHPQCPEPEGAAKSRRSARDQVHQTAQQ